MTDIPANATTTANITIGGTYTGSLETNGDHDWIAVTLVAGQKYTFTLDGVGSNALEDPYLYLRNSSGTLLAENDDYGTRDSRIVFTATQTGTYYLDASSWSDPTHNYTGGYQLTAQLFTPPPVYSYAQIADELVNGYWGGDWHHFDVTQGGTITVNLTGLTAAGQTLARAALAEWADVIGVTFKEVTTTTNGVPDGQIVFDDSDTGAYTSSDWTNHIITKSNVNISTDWINDYGTGLNSYSFQTYVHEIGHALGLGHGGNYNETATYPDDALYANDAWSTTVMSYFSPQDSSYFAEQNFTYDFALTPMTGDIVAMQTLYGLSTTTRTGNTTYGYGSTAGAVFNTSLNPHVAYTIIDSGGTDTLNYSLSSSNQSINLNPETFSNVAGDIGNVSIAIGTVIENATSGSGNDVIIGNSANNALNGGAGDDRLQGNAGNDTLDGGAGLDRMYGGTGNDTYMIRDATDYAYENSGQGTDLAIASINYTLRDDVENLTLSGTAGLTGKGNALDNEITGNSGANGLYGLDGIDHLYGNAGNDLLDGGNGADIMAGGTGNDTYTVDNSSDVVVENVGEGADRVNSTVDYTLGANIETLSLVGTADIGRGNDIANSIGGDAADNHLYGMGGNDRLYGQGGNDVLDGGTGIDGMRGGTGDDTYYIDNGHDAAVEYANEGTDLVISSVNVTLRANVENLTLTGTTAVNATGNIQDNVMTGSAGDNVLAGLGGNDHLYGMNGADVLRGGDGDDWIEGGAARDVMTGDTGADSFVFRDGDFAGLTASTSDQITDFSESAGDTIRLDYVDADATLAGDQGFAFMGTDAFDGHAGELRYEQINGATFVFGDTNGDSSADFMIRLDGLHTLASNDFVL